jgi:hypothetical protein
MERVATIGESTVSICKSSRSADDSLGVLGLVMVQEGRRQGEATEQHRRGAGKSANRGG